MCVKLPLGDLNPDPYPSYLTSIYTCEVTTAPKVRGGQMLENLKNILWRNKIY